LCSIPEYRNASELPLALSFAAPGEPDAFTRSLIAQKDLKKSLTNPQLEICRALSTGGAFKGVEEYDGRVPIPQLLQQKGMKNIWGDQPYRRSEDRRVFFVEFQQPLPGTMQAVIYRL